MAMTSIIKDWLTWSLSGSLTAVLLLFLLALAFPIINHYVLYRSAATSKTPSFFLLGPSNAGKTSLYTLLANGSPSKTHTSQEPQTTTITLPKTYTPASQQYRSANDPTSLTQTTYQLTDTPGHGKLRPTALTSALTDNSSRGLVFVTDSAALSSAPGMADAGNYLYEVLLGLQRVHEAKSSPAATAGPKTLGLLIAANKSDLFTSLPAQMVRDGLQAEIGRIRDTRSKALLVQSEDEEQEREWLGTVGEGSFTFEQMLDAAGVEVKVVSGSVVGNRGQEGDVAGWWAWFAEQL